jgi:hypothetical protein
MKTNRKNTRSFKADDMESESPQKCAYDEEYICQLESKNYSVSLPCLHERVITSHSIKKKSDLDEVEKSVRVILKCDFGSCIALETASYSRMRTRMLRLLRTHEEVSDSETTDRIQIAPNFVLEFNWYEYSISIIEKPQQQEINIEYEQRCFFLLCAQYQFKVTVLYAHRNGNGKRRRGYESDDGDVSTPCPKSHTPM